MQKFFILAAFLVTLGACRPAHAQVYDTTCPAGSSPAPNGEARNPANDHIKQNYCIDATGAPIINGPEMIIGPCTGTGSCTVILSGGGSPKLTAVYTGDNNFKGSTSVKVTQPVQP